MTVDRAWVKRNLGFDPIETPAPQNTFAMKDQAQRDRVLGSDCSGIARRLFERDRRSARRVV